MVFLFLLHTIFHADLVAQASFGKNLLFEKQGALIRSDSTKKQLYLCFTAHDFGEGFLKILQTLDAHNANASFFFTGDFIRNHPELVKLIYRKGHYVGPHSDKHLLYCDWNNRDSLLVSADSILKDLKSNLNELVKLGIPAQKCKTFMPPYEWYNSTVYTLVTKMGLLLVNFTPGTSSNADYTTPDAPNYVSSDTIFNRIVRYEQTHVSGLNGFHLLLHGGTDEKRKDKMYERLGELLEVLNEYDFISFSRKDAK